MSAAVFEDRSDPGRAISIALAAAMHVLLLAVLLFGVRWQNRPPEAVQVELWEPPAPAPAPVVEAPKPAPIVEAAPLPKPEPEIPKPDIVEKKAPPPPPKPKPEAEKKPPPPKPVPKAEPAKPRVDLAQKRMQEELAREQNSLAIERERAQIKDQLARDASSVDSKGLSEYQAKIRSKVRGNIVLPPDIKGNPEAIFDVIQIPSGDLVSVKLRKSSGHRAYDEAVERAIYKSAPLPKPDRPDQFRRELELKFRPLD